MTPYILRTETERNNRLSLPTNLPHCTNKEFILLQPME